MTNTTNPLPATIARTLRDLTPAAIPAALTAALLGATPAQLAALTDWTATVAVPSQLIGTDSRGLILAGVSAAIIDCGERADACKPGTRTNLAHLARMEAIDAFGAALLGG